MNSEYYIRIISVIRQHHGLTRNCMKLLIDKFPNERFETLYSILALEYQKRMKHTHGRNQMYKNMFYYLYLSSLAKRDDPGIIVRLAAEADVAPCLMAKLILDEHFQICSGEDEEQHKVSVNLNMYLRDTCLILDMDLSYEIFLCTIYDNIYSPLTETIRASLGQQYEIRLYKEALELGLEFRDEEYLRAQGFDKTPDCKLEVPILIDGFIVNWIESKALFGDEETHKEYMKNQYVCYWNRFGPGLVIYWFGFLENIVKPIDKRFIVKDHLPKNIVTLCPSFCARYS